MTKVILASHHRLADGMKDTLDYILPEHCQVQAISAYLQNVPVEEELTAALSDINPEDQVLIFTDMMGGSVNQACLPHILNNPNVHLIAGMNLPVVLALVLKAGAGQLTSQDIVNEIENAKEQIIYVNERLAANDEDEEDE